MTDPTEKTLKAIDLFIESMDVDAMKGRIRDDLSDYYLTCATDDEVQEFEDTWIKPENKPTMFVLTIMTEDSSDAVAMRLALNQAAENGQIVEPFELKTEIIK